MIETIRISDLTVLRALPAHATRPPVLFVHGYLAEHLAFPFDSSIGSGDLHDIGHAKRDEADFRLHAPPTLPVIP